jgi:hypothetical protein
MNAFDLTRSRGDRGVAQAVRFRRQSLRGGQLADEQGSSGNFGGSIGGGIPRWDRSYLPPMPRACRGKSPLSIGGPDAAWTVAAPDAANLHRRIVAWPHMEVDRARHGKLPCALRHARDIGDCRVSVHPRHVTIVPDTPVLGCRTILPHMEPSAARLLSPAADPTGFPEENKNKKTIIRSRRAAECIASSCHTTQST